MRTGQSPLAEAARLGWRMFYLGSAWGSRGAEILQQKFSGLQITTAHGYF